MNRMNPLYSKEKNMRDLPFSDCCYYDLLFLCVGMLVKVVGTHNLFFLVTDVILFINWIITVYLPGI